MSGKIFLVCAVIIALIPVAIEVFFPSIELRPIVSSIPAFVVVILGLFIKRDKKDTDKDKEKESATK